jgi:hypothetical protein
MLPWQGCRPRRTGAPKHGTGERGGFIDRAEDALSTAILLRCVWTGETEGNAMGGEERARDRVVKLLPVVRLKTLNVATELHTDKSMEGNEGG